jgi:hypothetical protein
MSPTPKIYAEMAPHEIPRAASILDDFQRSRRITDEDMIDRLDLAHLNPLDLIRSGRLSLPLRGAMTLYYRGLESPSLLMHALFLDFVDDHRRHVLHTLDKGLDSKPTTAMMHMFHAVDDGFKDSNRMEVNGVTVEIYRNDKRKKAEPDKK